MEWLTEIYTDSFGKSRAVLIEPSKGSLCSGCSRSSDDCGDCSLYKAIQKLNALEVAIGGNYDINRLKELVEADREGRLAILSEPMKSMVYKPNDTDVYCPNCGETLSGGWPLSDADDPRSMYQCPYCGQSIDTQACEPYEAAVEAMEGRENNEGTSGL